MIIWLELTPMVGGSAGRQLQAYKKKGPAYIDNSGTINARTSQSGSNVAIGSKNVNQANSNQNAQAAGNGASASNSAVVNQYNGTVLNTPALDKCTHKACCCM